MRKLVMKSLAALLALALLLTVLPATATTAKAADGDVTSDGIVLFDETFDTVNNATISGARSGTLASGHTFSAPYTTHTIKDGLLSIAAKAATNEYLDFTLSNLEIPATNGGNRCYVALKAELFIAENSATNRSASLQILSSKYSDGKDAGYTAVDGEVTAVIKKTSGTHTHIGYASSDGKNLVSMTIRVGARNDLNTSAEGTGIVVIDRIRISLVLHQVATPAAKDLRTYITPNTGYFKLNQDMAYDEGGYTGVIMGDNAVLDLNGHTLTMAGGRTLNVAGNAKIIDTSAEKTGKIVCDEGALNFANTAHPTLPIRTADDTGYVFAERPSLIADTHIFVDGEQTADKFTLHFRPGFGTLGGVNVRETYLAGGKSGIQMTANFTSKDIYGNESGSEDILLDKVFNEMYASQNHRGKMTFQGFEKYEKLEITLKLSSCGVTCTLPLYTVNNTKVTKHYASQFNAGANGDYGISNTTYSISNDGKLNYEGGTMLFALENAVATGANKTLVLEFDGSIPSGAPRAAFEARKGSARYSIFTANYYGSYNKLLSMDPFTGTKHIRMEIDLETFTANYFVDGSAKTPVSVAESELSNYIAAWNGLTSLYLSHNGNISTSTPFVVDNLMLYTIAS